jgi:ELWxxDGT repeat protein
MLLLDRPRRLALRLLVVAATLCPSTVPADQHGSNPGDFRALTRGDGSAARALFSATVVGRRCLWSTDGTPEGTFPVEPEGDCLPIFGETPITPLDGAGYLVVGDSEASRWWRSDGTASGTWPLFEFFDRFLWHYRAAIWTAPQNGLVYFLADDGVHGPEPWVSDGTRLSGRLFYDFVPGPGAPGPIDLQEHGTQVLALFWPAQDSSDRDQIWRSDGTPEGSQRLATFGGHTPNFELYPVANGAVFFFGALCPTQLWHSDGTIAGTREIRPFAPCQIEAKPFRFDQLPGLVFFTAEAEDEGIELWRTDGTAEGTYAVTAMASPHAFPFEQEFVLYRGDVYFSADEDPSVASPARAGSLQLAGRELWKTDGTPGGSHRVADLCPGSCSADPEGFAVVGDWLVFVAEGSDGLRHLWVSDGTAEGTRPANGGLCRGLCGARFFERFVLGESLLLVADDGLHGRQLWSFRPPDGVPQRLTEAPQTSTNFSRFAAAVIGPRAVFALDDGEHGREPWVTDGTPAGTRLLADLEDPAATPTPPGPPAALRFAGTVRLRWEDRSPDEDSFVVETAVGAAGEWRHLATVGADVTEYETTIEPDIPQHFRVRASRGGAQSLPSPGTVVVWRPCTPSDEHLCLGDGRFRVTVRWTDHHSPFGESGFGQPVRLPTGTDDSGSFWFFTPDNLELVVKLLDAGGVNDHFWFFWGALSDVQYSINVEDTALGTSQSYLNHPGQICGGSDTAAFPAIRSIDEVPTGTAQPARPHPLRSSTLAIAPRGSATRFLALDAPARIAAATHPTAPCEPDEQTLCLLDGMLAVTVDWTDQHNGGSGVGRAIPSTDVSGFFWFFHPENIELVVKALDGRTVNGKIWLFYGALSDVGYTIRVENRHDGHAVRNYTNPPGTICGQGDTAAF